MLSQQSSNAFLISIKVLNIFFGQDKRRWSQIRLYLELLEVIRSFPATQRRLTSTGEHRAPFCVLCVGGGELYR